MMNTLSLVIGGFVFGFTFYGCARTETPLPRSFASSQPTITPRAQKSSGYDALQIKLQTHSALKGSRVRLEWTSKGTMALRGTVKSNKQRKRALQIARKLVPGTPVTNELVIAR